MPVLTGEPVHTVEPQFPVAAEQLKLTLMVNANVELGATLMPATLTDERSAATVAVPLGGVAEAIVKPDGAVNESEPNDALFEDGLVKVAVIDCDDVPAVTGDGVTLRLYLHGDDNDVVIFDNCGWN